MKKLASVHSGAHSERLALSKPASARFLDETIHLLDLPQTDLAWFDGLIIPEGLNQNKLDAAADQLKEYLKQGGKVFLFGDQPTEWLPGVDWTFAVASPRQPGDLVRHHQDHSFHRYLALDDFWHCHGCFSPPEGARTMVSLITGEAVFYIDEVSTKGALIVSSLDLMHHVDGFFGNPVSARFYDKFLAWAVKDFI